MLPADMHGIALPCAGAALPRWLHASLTISAEHEVCRAQLSTSQHFTASAAPQPRSTRFSDSQLRGGGGGALISARLGYPGPRQH